MAKIIYKEGCEGRKKEKKYTFSIEEVQKARAECLRCPELAGSGYCNKINSDSFVFKYEKCKKIAAALEE